MERQRKTIESGRSAGPSMVLPAVVLAITFAFALGATYWFKPASDVDEGPVTTARQEAIEAAEAAQVAPAAAVSPVAQAPASQPSVAQAPVAQPPVAPVTFVPPPAVPAEQADVEPRATVPEGRAGVVEALRRGDLRIGSRADVERWVAAARASGQSVDPQRLLDGPMDVFVIKKDFTVPARLTGADAVIFVLDLGAPVPLGDLGHSIILDVPSGGCIGVTCRIMLSP